MRLEVEALRTAKGGFRKADLERLGIAWPPSKGWLKQLKTQLPDVDQDRLARENRERQAARHVKQKAKKAIVKARRQAELKAKPSKQPKTARKPTPKAASIYKSERWKRLRYEILCEQGSTCQLCGASPRDGSKVNVDHFYPLQSHPHLAFEKSNLRVLCASCNWGKGGRNPDQYEAANDVMPDEFAIPWDRFDKF